MASSTKALKRLRKEYSRLSKEKDISENISVGPVTDKYGKQNFFHWIGTIIGPVDTPFQGGIFKVDITIGKEYPFKAPKIKFITKMYHPNINEKGAICLDILKNKWTASLTIYKTVLSICTLLNDPNPSDPLVEHIANLYNRDRKAYEKKVTEYTRLYAGGTGKVKKDDEKENPDDNSDDESDDEKDDSGDESEDDKDDSGDES